MSNSLWESLPAQGGDADGQAGQLVPKWTWSGSNVEVRFNGFKGSTTRGSGGGQEHAKPSQLWQGFFHDLELLGDELGKKHCQSRNVAAGMREAGHVTKADRVCMSGEHYGDRLGRVSRGIRLR